MGSQIDPATGLLMLLLDDVPNPDWGPVCEDSEPFVGFTAAEWEAIGRGVYLKSTGTEVRFRQEAAADRLRKYVESREVQRPALPPAGHGTQDTGDGLEVRD